MILPRRLMTYTEKDGRVCFCEVDDTRQEMNYHGPGFVIPDIEAERTGLKAYLDATGWGDVADASKAPEVKAVAQAEVEDKAVDLAASEHAGESDAEDKSEPGPGLHVDRTIGRRGRTP